MNKNFFHKEVIVQRGNIANFFIVILSGKALILNSKGNKIKKELTKHQTYGLVETIKENKWKNTIVSEKNTNVLFVSRKILISNLFANKSSTSLSLNILKMAN